MDGSRVIHDRYPQPSYCSVGLPIEGSRCRDEACISGIFDWPSISLVYRPSGDGKIGTLIAAAIATTLATTIDSTPCIEGADSSTVDGIRSRYQREWYRIEET